LQLYYELKAEREKQGKEKEVAIIRVEQLAPFPFDLVCRELRRYPNAEIMWYALCCAALPLWMPLWMHAVIRESLIPRVGWWGEGGQCLGEMLRYSPEMSLSGTGISVPMSVFN